jgi:tripartite-type tricarboxylate transporter receptor subunit TctC
MKKLLVAATAVLALFAGAATAQTYPSKAITFVVGYPPGGGSDAAARLIAANMEKKLGQPIVVENRPGGNTLIAANSVARSAADGYTLLFGPVTVLTSIFNKNPIDVKATFEPISNLINGGLVLSMREDFPAKNWAEFLAYSKANPGKLNYASIAPQAEMLTQLLANRTGLTYTAVNYAGDAPIVNAMLTKEVDFGMNNVVVAVPQIKAGKFKPLMITKSTRSALLPDLPTPQELGIKDFLYEFNLGLWAPKGTPKDVIAKLNAAAVAVMKDPALTNEFVTRVGDPVGSTPEQQMATFENEYKLNAEAAKMANYQPQ